MASEIPFVSKTWVDANRKEFQARMEGVFRDTESAETSISLGWKGIAKKVILPRYIKKHFLQKKSPGKNHPTERFSIQFMRLNPNIT